MKLRKLFLKPLEGLGARTRHKYELIFTHIHTHISFDADFDAYHLITFTRCGR